ncbi:flagellar filament capping protein FliD [Bacillus sp. MCCB 382]|uniref:flagellar filament capping protein FliD n=1 Tax=Bacillus sp. MCCB 382 TaxID=2860197 RepID=UPI001C58A547|nr:flagellar filament capping protein FliD [Bacillus sp. MCCB 382]
MRIGGLASGMDIDSLVADLMKAERMPLDKLKQKKQTLEWQRDDYRSMNTLLLDFRSELTQMKLSTNYRARTTSSTNSDYVTATASSAASQSSYSIKNVTQLASAAVLKNAGGVSASSTDKMDATKSLHSQNTKMRNSLTWSAGVVESKNFTVASEGTTELSLDGLNAIDSNAVNIKVDGKVFKVVQSPPTSDGEIFLDTTNDKLLFGGAGLKKGAVVNAQFVTENKTDSTTLTQPSSSWQLSRGSIHSVDAIKINDVTYSVSDGSNDTLDIKDASDNIVGFINKETGKVNFNTEQAKDTKIEVTYKQNYTSFSLGAHTSKGETSETFLVQGSQSLNSVMEKVNSSSVGVTMFYDSFSDQLTLTRKETGNFNEAGKEIIKSGTFMNSFLRFGSGTETDGQDAIFNLNGLDTRRHSNTFEMNGVTLNIKNTFTDPVSISVNNDSTKVFDNIKEFVTKYNELIDKIQKKTSEDYYRSYQPLTDEQRESLSDKQQEQWEEKAKSGLLKRDPILTGVLSQMRTDFYAPVSNEKVSSAFSQLASIGITTSSNYLEGGKLVINDADLKKAIESDPESVENLFRGDGNTFNQKGLVQRLYDSVNQSMDKLKEKAGNSFSTNQQFSLGRELTNVDSSIDRFQDRLKQVEDRYWRQFTAMEKAIQRSNEQSMFLMNQFGG